MKLTFTISEEDWAAVQAHQLETWPGFRESIFFWRWTFAVGLGIVAVLLAADWPGWARGVLGISAALGLYLWYPRYMRKGYRTRARAQLNLKESRPFLTCERVIEVTTEGLRIESLIGNQFIKWVFVKAVDDAPSHVFINFRYGLGFPIPKTCMTSAEKDSLVGVIRAHITPPIKPLQQTVAPQ
jgi:hypothetical protein